MPNMKQKVSSFLEEQKEFITEDCLKSLVTLFEKGPMNITFLAETIEIKQHRMPPVIAVLEAFGFIELYKSGQSKEYAITDFGEEYLKQQNLLPEKEELHVSEPPNIDEIPSSNGQEVQILQRIFRLISLGKRNSIAEIAETMVVEENEIKDILEQLTLAKMIQNSFVNRERRYQLTELGESFYQLIRGKGNKEELQKQLQKHSPRLFDTLVELKSGGILYQEELNYAITLGLVLKTEKDINLTELGNKII